MKLPAAIHEFETKNGVFPPAGQQLAVHQTLLSFPGFLLLVWPSSPAEAAGAALSGSAAAAAGGCAAAAAADGVAAGVGLSAAACRSAGTGAVSPGFTGTSFWLGTARASAGSMRVVHLHGGSSDLHPAGSVFYMVGRI